MDENKVAKYGTKWYIRFQLGWKHAKQETGDTNMTIRRDFYVNRLIAAKHDNFIKIIVGMRRCGKSYLLFNLFKQHLLDSGVSPDHIIEIDLERPLVANLVNPIELDKYIRSRIMSDGQMHYVLIDEIQYCGKALPDGIDISRIHPDDRKRMSVDFYRVLNGLRTTPNVDVYVTGSNSRMLASDIATEFRGRGETIQVAPLSFEEFANLRQDMRDYHAMLREYLMFGGLPECVLKTDESLKKAYLSGLCRTIYLKDVQERNNIKDSALLEVLFDIAMSNVGCLMNPTKFANAVQTVARIPANHVTVKKYLGFLQDSYLLSKVNRYDVRGRHYLDYPAKYYAIDTGIRNVHVNFRQYEPTHLMENAIYNELVRRGYAVDVGMTKVETSSSGKREKRQYEIDFVVNRFSERVYIQSAWMVSDEDKREQEIFSLRHTGDSFRKIVVTGDPYEKPWMDDNGITFMGIVPFLLDSKSIETL